MRIGAYNPYLWTRGGGERYFLSACLELAHVHDVEVIVPAGTGTIDDLRDGLTRTFGLDLESLRFVAAAGDDPRAILRAYDGCLTVSNEVPLRDIPRPHVCIEQFPWGIAGWPVHRRAKAMWAFAGADRVLVYSAYVRRYVAPLAPRRTAVVPPGVPPIPDGPEAKERVIIGVGRLTAGGHSKNHAMMIDTFRRLSSEARGTRLVLAGAAGTGDMPHIEELRRRAEGLDVQILPNLPRPDLESLYRSASILWHAAGYGARRWRAPELMEHFGIVAVEAMSAGAVPLVFRGGGLPGIVRDGRDGYLWKTREELVDRTATLLRSDSLRGQMATSARERASAFSPDVFRRVFWAAMPERLQPKR